MKPVGYSYWANINNHAGSDTMLIMLGLDRQKGGAGPTLFSYNKRTGATQNLGPIFSANSPYSSASGEGWYFSATRPTTLYLNDGSRMLRYDVQSRTVSTVYDIAGQLGSDKYIWQIHSSGDDRVHSATVRQTGTWQMLGCAAYREDTGRLLYVPRKGVYDECQVDKSGRWLVIKEDLDGRHGEDNRVIDLNDGSERVLLDEDGAAGHSDLGHGYMVAEDNFNPQPGAVRVWQFGMTLRGGEPVSSVRGQGILSYQLTSWSSGLGHIAHGNSRANTALGQQMACVSNATRQNLSRANEITCFRLDESLKALVVAPNLADLNASGGGTDDYWKMPKGNIDVTGEYFIWTANAGTNRLDAFLVRIPRAKLDAQGGSAPSPTPTPTPSPSPTPAPTPPPGNPSSTSPQLVQWTSLVNTVGSAGTLRKSGGCNGCPDAGALSAQRITSGDGAVEFTTSDTAGLRVVGLGPGNPGTSAGEILFGMRLQKGRIEVRESGTYKTDVAFVAGDKLRVAVTGGVVTYSKNGSVFYKSASRPVYPLVVDTSFSDLGAAIENAQIRVGP